MIAPTPFLGRTVFEDANGRAIFTADWQLPKQLRPLEVTLSRGTFGAQRQLADGSWVYRFVRPRHESEVIEPYFSDFQDLAPPEVPPPTLKDAREMVLGLIREAQKTKGLLPAKSLKPLAELLKTLESA